MRRTTATIFPSVEYVDDSQKISLSSGSGGMVQTTQPVWRSQVLRSDPLPNAVNRRPSGEKLSKQVVYGEGERVLVRPRVVASRISTTVYPAKASATNLLHGDHADAETYRGVCMLAAVGSHEVGKPCTTLARGRVYCSYSRRTIDVRGDSNSAV